MAENVREVHPPHIHYEFPLPDREQRFKELILYICQKSATDRKFGATKLNKILYFADFLAYGRWRTPLTGMEYQREKNGPVPKRLVPIREEMIGAGELALQPVPLVSGWTQHRAVNLRPPRLDFFKPHEIALIDSILEELRDSTADDVSELSHRMVGWKIAEPGESIPYETVFVSAEPLTEADIQRAKELEKKLSEHGR